MFLSSPRVDSIFSRENCRALGSVILGHPGVEVIDGVVQKLPFLDQGVNLLAPLVRDALDGCVPLLESGDFVISLLVCGHLLGSGVGAVQDLQVLAASLVKVVDLLVELLNNNQ